MEVEVAYVECGKLGAGTREDAMKTSLASSSDAVGVPTLPVKLMRLPLMGMCVRLGSLFSGRTLQTTLV